VRIVVLLAGLFGHRRAPDDPVAVQWLHATLQWASAHWAALAVIIPVAGAIAAGIVNHYLAVARENRARRLTRGDVRARVYADLAARLLSHCSAIYAAVVNPGAADPQSWRVGNAGLRTRSETHDVVDALGQHYVSFMAAIEQERRTIDALARTGVAAGAVHIIELYVPFIDEFGEPVQARRLKKFASEALKRTSSGR
jgi:hypothetical protein